MGAEYSRLPTVDPSSVQRQADNGRLQQEVKNDIQDQTPPRQKTWIDPRSPSSKIDRTPLVDKNESLSKEKATPTLPVFKQTPFDPRSPSNGISRTPVEISQRKRCPFPSTQPKENHQ
jgi:hypothetical protein